MSSAGDFCAICGVPRAEHQSAPPPGPPDPPPERHEGVWRPRHAFKDSGRSFAEVLDERDAQIGFWRKRAYRAEGLLQQVRAVVEPKKGKAAPRWHVQPLREIKADVYPTPEPEERGS